MNIGKYNFNKICRIKPYLNSDGSVYKYSAHERYRNLKELTLHKYGKGPFCKFKIQKNLNISGVYLIKIGNEILYVGECVNLSDRFNNGYGHISPRNCFSNGQETNCRINNLILQNSEMKIKLYFLRTKKYKEIEKNIIEKLGPKWNR